MVAIGEGSKGREDALEALYRAHASDFVRLAYVLTGDPHVAEDVAHEAFVRAGRKLFGLRDPERARGYLYRTVVNLCRGRGRKLARERAATARLPRPERTALPEPVEHDALWDALLGLPLRQRTALFLRYYQDLSEVQTAETLGCSLSAVKSLVNRGLAELRATVERGEP